MSIIERHLPGTFSWFELATTDSAAAKQFYSELFGWTADDNDTGPGGAYTMFKLNGFEVAGGYALTPEMTAQGIPPHWDLYIAVDSVDDAASQIESFGGKILQPPCDVMTFGRMTVAADPTGAVFCLWQPLTHIGTRVDREDGVVCWADLMTPDPEAASQFYAGVFGWQTYKAENDDSDYLHIKAGEAPIGGIPPAHLMPPGAPAHWMLYFLVSNAEAATQRAVSLGARTLMPVTELPKAGKFSIVRDPQGASFALFESGRHSAKG